MAGEVLDMVIGAWDPVGRLLPASALVLSKETKAAIVRIANTVLREEFVFIRAQILDQFLRVSIICVVFFQKKLLGMVQRRERGSPEGSNPSD